ncbi:hypothetical protein N836_32250 [Leptolyngbya sp. Heron Island J]|uniref:hypothetical protein n=1 Tax=Leptolyngbya sp. Heron Island J TaxID=1385935 RepID=UPI0003B9E87A|nr:hypothetical protein [Leptolyngbya sp. Heron Island J]ESA38613.1 hypothetical protein N836_32250 [Leptolyngbya sp. Heron Island J]
MNVFQSFSHFCKQHLLTVALATATTLALSNVAIANPTQPSQKIVVEPAKTTNVQTKQNRRSNSQVLRFDIAEDATRFVFDDAPLLSNGFPAYGNSFVTQGYIYPAGTLNGSNGVNPDGSPEFPALVQGRWVCRGWFVNPDGAAAASGEFVITHQLYNFGHELGDETLVSDGWEIADVGEPVARAIIGGTGRYRNASGEAVQAFLGFNATEGVNLTFELTVDY